MAFRGVLRQLFFKMVNTATFRGVLRRFTIILLQNCVCAAVRGVLLRYYFKLKKSTAFRGVFEQNKKSIRGAADRPRRGVFKNLMKNPRRHGNSRFYYRI